MTRVVRHEGDPARTAVIAPGSRYTVDNPLLYYVRRVLVDRGWTVLDLWWEDPRRPWQPWVSAQVAEALGEPGELTLVVGKSLGTLSLPFAAERNLPGVWLTPLLDEPGIAQAVATLAQHRVPTLLVGGTDDDYWNPALIADGVEVVEFAGANHGLEVTGDVAGSIHNLAAVADAVDRFAARLTTP